MNEIYSDQLHYISLQQLATLILPLGGQKCPRKKKKILRLKQRNSDEMKLNT